MVKKATKRAPVPAKRAPKSEATLAARRGESAQEVVPHTASLDTLRRASKSCRACPLGEPATQTVFGAGARSARVVLIGEQPGNQEDLEGEPFVGPAGRM